MPEPIPIRPTHAPANELDALTAITDAVESGLGLPEVVRAAARALDASLILIDSSSSVLAVAARSTADERALMADAAGVDTHELRVGDAVVGRLRARGRAGEPPPVLLRVVTTLIASEVERLRAPERASEAAQAAFLAAVLRRDVTDRGDIVARAAELGVDVADGAAMIVVRTHHFAPADEDWRGRVLAAAERAARASAPGSLAAVVDAGHVVVLLPAMSEDPAELQRFFAETVEPLVTYDEQYETGLVQTLETFLDADANVAGTAARLFTHRHTIRYRLERVRDLTGLDVSSTDGREKLGLGLKAMRVLGIAAPSGPASEDGAGGGRVPREPRDR